MNQLVDVGDTKLYCEVQGDGPSVVLVPGATGDGGYMQPLADALADEFKVVTYDRRGNSRSPAPDGWTQTSVEEQARDLAGLMTALDLGRPSSSGTAGVRSSLCVPPWTMSPFFVERCCTTLDPFDDVALSTSRIARGAPAIRETIVMDTMTSRAPFEVRRS